MYTLRTGLARYAPCFSLWERFSSYRLSRFRRFSYCGFIEFDRRIARAAQDRSVFVEYASGVFNIELTQPLPSDMRDVRTHLR